MPVRFRPAAFIVSGIHSYDETGLGLSLIHIFVAPSNEYIYASGANELTVVEGCVIAVGGAGIFKTANTILTAANLDAGSAFTVGKDYYVYICDSRIDSADEKYVCLLYTSPAPYAAVSGLYFLFPVVLGY